MDNTGKLAGKLSKMKNKLQEWGIHISQCFKSTPTAKLALSYVEALMSQVERKNGWQLAEEMNHKTPDRVQKLLNSASWDVEQVLEQHWQRVGKCLGFEGGILAFDETGFLKKGTKSAGVARQYTGTSGQVDNCQIGVFASWKTDQGHTLVDRELYLPDECTSS
jgi:SRSO17 transposase